MPLPLRAAMLAYKCCKLNAYVAGAKHARKAQHETLLAKIRRNEASAFGHDFGFNEIRSVDDFRRRVPVADYEPHRPYIERVMRGETTAMFTADTKILMFATTSGTTNKPKLLPVTKEFYRAYRNGWQLWGTGVFRDYRSLLSQTTLQLSSDWKTSFAPSGIPIGNISGLAAETRPFYMKPSFVLPLDVIRIRDHEAKHYTALRIAMASDRVGMLVTANPSTLVEFARRADRERESLVRDIHDGTLSSDVEVNAKIRGQLQSRFKSNKRRARQLESIIDQTGTLYPKDVWPNLRVLAVWTGGSVGVYLSQLPEFYGDLPIRDHGISASEGRSSIPLRCGTQAGMLDYRSHFYEFIPEDEYGHDKPTVLEAHELTPGKNYFLLLTNDAGLYRYDICDMVRCDGYQGESPLMSFMNKGRHFSSITGEKLSEYQVVQAMKESFAALDLPSCTFTLAPTMGARPRYNLVVEPGAHSSRSAQLATEVQTRLEKINVEYGDKCQSGRIEPIQVSEIPAGTWSAFRCERSRERGNFEEFKHPCLTSDLEFIKNLPRVKEEITHRVAS